MTDLGNWLKRGAVALVLWLMAGALALACSFHTYTPAPTVIDRMLGSDHIVLARPDPTDPTRFVAVSAIRGHAGDADLPFDLDPLTRHRLEAAPDDAVLFARDGAYGPWRELAYLDPDYRALIDTVAPKLDHWEIDGDFERFEIFAALHGHDNPALRHLAYRELDRAPYEILQALDLKVDVPEVLALIDQPQDADLRPIRLLLLGLSGDADAVPFLRRGLTRAHDAEPPAYLGAYATALIELTGDVGVAEVEALVTDRTIPIEIREQLIEALAIHAFFDPDLGAGIATRLGPILSQDVGLGGAIARQFGVRGDWSFHAPFVTLLDQGVVRNPYDLIALNQYVMIASESAALD
ncbi:MAG: hypothetical protein OIF47_08545 [Marinibacterium sp.]|nr:hypothetical protein [Marinibacterium sp.]